jgi:hypothetical protein
MNKEYEEILEGRATSRSHSMAPTNRFREGQADQWPESSRETGFSSGDGFSFSFDMKLWRRNTCEHEDSIVGGQEKDEQLVDTIEIN